MIGWHHQLNGHECEQISGDSEGQGSLACCSPRGRKELDTTQRLNSNNRDFILVFKNQLVIAGQRRKRGRPGCEKTCLSELNQGKMEKCKGKMVVVIPSLGRV